MAEENSPSEKLNLVAASNRLKHQRNFTRVPNELIEHKDLTPQAKMVWIALWRFCFSGDSVFPGMKRLSKILNYSTETVRKYRKELEGKGLLKMKRRGLGKTNIYYLFCPDPKGGWDQETKGGWDQETKGGLDQESKGGSDQEPDENPDSDKERLPKNGSNKTSSNKTKNNNTSPKGESEDSIQGFYLEEPDKHISSWKAPDFVKYLCFSYYQKFSEVIPPKWNINGKHFKRCLNCQGPEVVKDCLDKLFSLNGRSVTSGAWVYNALDKFVAGTLKGNGSNKAKIRKKLNAKYGGKNE